MLSLDTIIIFINPGKKFINGEPKWHPSWRRLVRWFFYYSMEAIILLKYFTPRLSRIIEILLYLKISLTEISHVAKLSAWLSNFDH